MYDVITRYRKNEKSSEMGLDTQRAREGLVPSGTEYNLH